MFGVRTPSDDARDGTDDPQAPDLVACLNAGADDADNLDVRRCEQICRDGPRRSGADVREETVVEEKCDRQTRRRVEDSHQARPARQSFRGIIVKAAGHLDRDVGNSLDERCLDVKLTLWRRHVQVDDCGDHGASLAVSRERRPYRLDRDVRGDGGPQGGFVDDGQHHAPTGSLRPRAMKIVIAAQTPAADVGEQISPVFPTVTSRSPACSNHIAIDVRSKPSQRSCCSSRSHCMGMRVGVGQDDHASRLQHPGHFPNGRCRIGCVMQHHVGDHDIHRAVGQRKAINFAGPRLERTSLELCRGRRQHLLREVDSNDARAGIKGRLGKESRSGANIGDLVARLDSGCRDHLASHTIAEEALAHPIPFRGHVVEVVPCI